MIFSIDVECVAVGTDHNSRSVAQISLVVRASLSSVCIDVGGDQGIFL
jgi:hypothetical protein